MYVQGLDRQLHDKEIAIDEKIRDAEKNMAKLEGKIKDTISFQKALKNLIKVVMGGSSEGDL
jgi:phage shock protein A